MFLIPTRIFTSKITKLCPICLQSGPQGDPQIHLKSLKIQVWTQRCPKRCPYGFLGHHNGSQGAKMETPGPQNYRFGYKNGPFQQASNQKLPALKICCCPVACWQGGGRRQGAKTSTGHIYIYVYTCICICIYIHICIYIYILKSQGRSPMLSYAFLMLFLCFAFSVLIVLLWFSYGLPLLLLCFSYAFPMLFLRFLLLLHVRRTQKSSPRSPEELRRAPKNSEEHSEEPRRTQKSPEELRNAYNSTEIHINPCKFT